MELSKDSTYDEVCEALAERLREEGQAEALHLEDPQQLRFNGAAVLDRHHPQDHALQVAPVGRPAPGEPPLHISCLSDSPRGQYRIQVVVAALQGVVVLDGLPSQSFMPPLEGRPCTREHLVRQ